MQEDGFGRRMSCVSLQVTLHWLHPIQYMWKKKISPVLCEQEDACMRDSASWTNAGTKALLRVSAYPLTQTEAYLERVA